MCSLTIVCTCKKQSPHWADHADNCAMKLGCLLMESRQQVERLEKVMRELVDGSHDTFPDASYLQCKHQRYGYEGCTICYDEALEAALEGGKGNDHV